MTAPVSTRRRVPRPLPMDRLALLEGWGMVSRSLSYVYRPSTIAGVRQVLHLARETGHAIIPRGSGYSYGDPALNAEGIVVDLTRMNRILDWNPESGVIRVEPGVTVRDLWRAIIEDGYWPPVVPGAMYPTMGGCLATNVHGKNNWHAGSFGEHVLSVEVLLPSGEIISCGPDREREVFDAVVGCLGLAGIVVEMTLHMKRVTSGRLAVREVVAPSLQKMFALFDEHHTTADYLVGWIDAFADGAARGRGLVQIAYEDREVPRRDAALRADEQVLPDTVLGLVPRSRLWLAMKPTVNDIAMRGLNSARYALGRAREGRIVSVPLAQFHFFHDFVPGWKRAWWPAGLLEYQPFVPVPSAPGVFSKLLEGSLRGGLVPYLAVFKRQRRDPFLLGYGVDGYSLALQYHVTHANTDRLQTMLRRFTHELVLPAGGRFYPAKDTLLDEDTARRSFGADSVERFLDLKRRLDPEGLLQSDMYRRLFARTSA